MDPGEPDDNMSAGKFLGTFFSGILAVAGLGWVIDKLTTKNKPIMALPAKALPEQLVLTEGAERVTSRTDFVRMLQTYIESGEPLSLRADGESGVQNVEIIVSELSQLHERIHDGRELFVFRHGDYVTLAPDEPRRLKDMPYLAVFRFAGKADAFQVCSQGGGQVVHVVTKNGTFYRCDANLMNEPVVFLGVTDEESAYFSRVV